MTQGTSSFSPFRVFWGPSWGPWSAETCNRCWWPRCQWCSLFRESRGHESVSPHVLHSGSCASCDQLQIWLPLHVYFLKSFHTKNMICATSFQVYTVQYARAHLNNTRIYLIFLDVSATASSSSWIISCAMIEVSSKDLIFVWRLSSPPPSRPCGRIIYALSPLTRRLLPGSWVNNDNHEIVPVQSYPCYLNMLRSSRQFFCRLERPQRIKN